MCDTGQAVAILGEVCRACNKAFEKKICDAWLYGSYARGDYNADSDQCAESGFLSAHFVIK